MKTKELVLELCKREKKRKQINIAQMTETVGHLADIFGEMSHLQFTIVTVELGKLYIKRAIKKAKAKKK